jgi:hypothetical protein
MRLLLLLLLLLLLSLLPLLLLLLLLLLPARLRPTLLQLNRGDRRGLEGLPKKSNTIREFESEITQVEIKRKRGENSDFARQYPGMGYGEKKGAEWW